MSLFFCFILNREYGSRTLYTCHFFSQINLWKPLLLKFTCRQTLHQPKPSSLQIHKGESFKHRNKHWFQVRVLIPHLIIRIMMSVNIYVQVFLWTREQTSVLCGLYINHHCLTLRKRSQLFSQQIVETPW